MSEDFVRSVLKEHLRENMPNSQDPWPEIMGRIQGNKIEPRSWVASSVRPLTAFAGMAAVVALVLVLAGAFTSTAQPKLASAEAIVAEAEKVSQDASASGLRSGYSVEHWRHNEINPDTMEMKDSVLEGRTETWYQAPDKLLSNGRSHSTADGSFEYSTLEIGDTLYSSLSSLPHVRLDMRRPDAPRAFSPLFSKDLYASTPGIGPVDKPYTVTLVGTEQILGRDAYVVEWNATPEVLEAEAAGIGFSLIRHKYRIWIDQQFYLQLKMQSWNKDGVWIDDRIVETLELNQRVDQALFEFKHRAGFFVADMRPASDNDMAKGWREVSKQVGVTLYEPGEAALSFAEARVPYYEASQGAVSQSLVRQTGRGRYYLDALIVQGPPSAIDESLLGSSTPMQVGSRQARLYRKSEAYQLVFDIEGTRIMLYSANSGEHGEVESRLLSIGESLEPVGKK